MDQSAFLSSVEQFMYSQSYAESTIKAYVLWIRRYISFHGRRHPASMGQSQVEEFISYLVLEKKVATKTQVLASSALDFLYKEFIKTSSVSSGKIKKSKGISKLPAVLTKDQVSLLLGHVPTKYYLIVSMLYSSGLRLDESLQLRVRDIDLGDKCLRVWDREYEHYRTVNLAPELLPHLRTQLQKIEGAVWHDARDAKYGGVALPNVIQHKYGKMSKDLGWHYLFPSHKKNIDQKNSISQQHPIDAVEIQTIIYDAAKQAKIDQYVSANTLRYSHAAHTLGLGTRIQAIRDEFGQENLNKTQVYLLVLRMAGRAVKRTFFSVVTKCRGRRQEA